MIIPTPRRANPRGEGEGFGEEEEDNRWNVPCAPIPELHFGSALPQRISVSAGTKRSLLLGSHPPRGTVEFILRTGALSRVKGGFPGGAVVENLPASAGDTGSSPGLGRPHMPRSSWAREPQLLSLCVWSLCSATREAAIVRGPRTAMKSGPRLPQLEKALAQKQRPNTAINK